MGARSDNFNRADASSPIGSPSDGGAGWAAYAGLPWGISSNRCYQPGGSANAILGLDSADITNMVVEVTMAVQGSFSGPCARITNNNNLFNLRSNNGAGWVFQKRVAGTWTTIGSRIGTNAAGDVLRIECEGNTLRAYANGVQVGSDVTDSFNNTATIGGLYAGGDSTSRFDDFSITEFSAGGTPIAFTGTVPTLNGTEGAAFSESLTGYFSGTETPFAYTVQSGTLPAGLTLNSSTGAISGTPTTAGTSSGIVVRGTDATPDTADTNSFSIVIAAPASLPGTPGAPTFASVTKNSYTTSWMAASGATAYDYRINGGAWVDVGNVLTIGITVRTPGATDTFEVRGRNGTGNGPASSATVKLLLWGFALSTAPGLAFGALAGTLTAIAREATGASWTIFVHNDATRALILTSTAQTINSSGRLPDYSNAALDSGTYFVSFRRADGEFASARIATADLS